jgi:prefoldin subunit 5
MPESTGPHYTLLDELDTRQDQVMAQLDELNQRIEQLLREFTQPQQAAAPAEKAA